MSGRLQGREELLPAALACFQVGLRFVLVRRFPWRRRRAVHIRSSSRRSSRPLPLFPGHPRHPLGPQGSSRLSVPDSPPPIILAYLDDIVILTDNPSTIDHVDDFLASRHYSLSLNRSKSTIDDVEAIRRTGITLLGTAVGSTDFRRAFLEKKVDEQVRLLEQLPSLSFQSALLLLRQCIQHNLRHLQRCLKTVDLPHCCKERGRRERVERVVCFCDILNKREAYRCVVLRA
jgi:hypothetical protein